MRRGALAHPAHRERRIRHILRLGRCRAAPRPEPRPAAAGRCGCRSTVTSSGAVPATSRFTTQPVAASPVAAQDRRLRRFATCRNREWSRRPPTARKRAPFGPTQPNDVRARAGAAGSGSAGCRRRSARRAAPAPAERRPARAPRPPSACSVDQGTSTPRSILPSAAGSGAAVVIGHPSRLARALRPRHIRGSAAACARASKRAPARPAARRARPARRAAAVARSAAETRQRAASARSGTGRGSGPTTARTPSRRRNRAAPG